MLTVRRALVATVVIVASLIVTAAPAAAEVVCAQFDALGRCTVWVETAPDPGGGPSGGGAGGGGGSVAMILVDGQMCAPAGPTDPQPPLSDPVWDGHTDGAIYDCVVGPALTGGFQAPLTLRYWSATPLAAVPDPSVLAQQAVDSMGLRAIRVGIVPRADAGSVGLVGVPNWMWVDAPDAVTFGPNTASATAGGWTVTATARVESVTWNLGDGQVVTCGAGTPYRASYGARPSPDCGHVYTEQGQYTVTATSHWVITWSGIGQVGTIAMDLAESALVTIGEAQVLRQ
jgi:hypothetical protein